MFFCWCRHSFGLFNICATISMLQPDLFHRLICDWNRYQRWSVTPVCFVVHAFSDGKNMYQINRILWKRDSSTTSNYVTSGQMQQLMTTLCISRTQINAIQGVVAVTKIYCCEVGVQCRTVIKMSKGVLLSCVSGRLLEATVTVLDQRACAFCTLRRQPIVATITL